VSHPANAARKYEYTLADCRGFRHDHTGHSRLIPPR
jgi:hypothetical protein